MAMLINYAEILRTKELAIKNIADLTELIEVFEEKPYKTAEDRKILQQMHTDLLWCKDTKAHLEKKNLIICN